MDMVVLLYCKLYHAKNNLYYNTLKYKIKELLGKNTQPYMDMKEINDILLQQIVCNYRDRNYSVKIADDLKKITAIIDLR